MNLANVIILYLMHIEHMPTHPMAVPSEMQRNISPQANTTDTNPRKL